MRFSDKHSALLASTALAGALAAFAAPAQAQMYSSGPGFYLSAEGRYIWNTGDKASNFFYADRPALDGGLFTPYDTSRAAPDKGWGGKAMLGYRFGNNWDVGVGVALNRLKGKDSTFTYEPGVEVNGGIVVGRLRDHLSTKLNYGTIDFEAGYNMPLGATSTVRLFGGLRFASFNQKTKASADNVQFPGGYYDYSGNRKTTVRGIGPRIGVNASLGLAGGFNIFGGLSGSLLAARFKDMRHFTYTPGGPDDDVTVTDKKSKIVPNAEGELGIGYNFRAGGSTVGLQLGYRGEAWWGVAAKGDTIGPYAQQKGSGDDFFHGPFVRLIATFGSAAPMPMASAPPPTTPPMMVKSFIVFFDFDKSNITAEAQKTINDAVVAAKSGGSSRVTLTGHTDRSGSEQYNMALSLRRAEAVKANMIRQGVPASAIVVIGKGESAPLVPTADGVREPQNRRVEIVI